MKKMDFCGELVLIFCIFLLGIFFSLCYIENKGPYYTICNVITSVEKNWVDSILVLGNRAVVKCSRGVAPIVFIG